MTKARQVVSVWLPPNDPVEVQKWQQTTGIALEPMEYMEQAKRARNPGQKFHLVSMTVDEMLQISQEQGFPNLEDSWQKMIGNWSSLSVEKAVRYAINLGWEVTRRSDSSESVYLIHEASSLSLRISDHKRRLQGKGRKSQCTVDVFFCREWEKLIDLATKGILARPSDLRRMKLKEA